MVDETAPTAPPAPRAHPAATVVVLRARADELVCFMLRRSGQSPFMPHSLVFPGGRLDETDGDPLDDATWARAAARECLEEAGLVVDPGALRWFDTWCTPSIEQRRFVARFFVITLADGVGDEAAADGSETVEGRWWTAAEALAAWRAGEADLPPPTLCTLLTLERVGAAGFPAEDLAGLAAPILPKIAIEAGCVQVVMPHDDDYAVYPGEAAAAPPRALALPRRFMRKDGRWIPS